MKLDEFNENYDLTRSGRAVEKSGSPVASQVVRHTADGEIFDGKEHFFFDETALTVRSSVGFVPNGDYLGANGFKVIAISKLRRSRDSALSDGQEYLRQKIESASALIAKFELEKTPASRSLKDYLMASDASK